MKRRYYPYDQWEDWKHGMYRSVLDPSAVEPALANAASLLGAPTELQGVMADVVARWPIAASQNLSDLTSNRRAWLGQAACALRHDVPAYVTKKAWWILTPNQRREANIAADTVIRIWEMEDQQCPEPRSQESMF